MKEIVYLAGLPRSGSTLLANVLSMHPEIMATPSSPLCGIIQSMRRQWSDDPFLLSQLDSDFERVHDRLKRSIVAFMQAWGEEGKGDIVVDKNRAWIYCLEWLRELDPNFKIIITVRDLRNIYASIEKRHRKTLFLDFPDHMEHNLVDARASSIFSDNGLVGSVLKGIQNIYDVHDSLSHMFFWRYEDFLKNPQDTMNALFDFLGVEERDIDFDNIPQITNESDSWHRMKYSHKIKNSIVVPEGFNDVPISPRILNEITNKFSWFYENLYADLSGDSVVTQGVLSNSEEEVDIVERKQEITHDKEEVVKKIETEEDLDNLAASLEDEILEETEK